MRDARRGRRHAAPFGFVLFLAWVLGACAPFATPRATPDRMAAVIAGARVQLSPEVTLPAGSGFQAALSLERISDRPIARDLHVTLTDAAGVPVDDATVVVVAQMGGMTDAPVQAAARADGAGRYVVRVVFPMSGAYAVQVIVTGRGAVGSLRFEIDIAS